MSPPRPSAVRRSLLLGLAFLALLAAAPSPGSPAEKGTAATLAEVERLNEEARDLYHDDPGRAIAAAERALALARAASIRSTQSRSLSFLGLAHRSRNDFDQSLRCFREALQIATGLGDAEQIAYSHSNLGGTYRVQGDVPRAMESFLAALRLFEAQGNERGVAQVLENLSLVHREQRQLAQALETGERAMALRAKLGDDLGRAKNLLITADVLCEMGRFRTALARYQEAEAVYGREGKKFQRAACLGGIAGAHYALGDYGRALAYRMQALNLNTELGHQENIVRTHLALGRIHGKTGHLREAGESLGRALALARQTGINARVLECLDALGEQQEAAGDPGAALRSFKEAAALRASILNEENTRTLAEMQGRYNTERKERENDLLKRDNALIRAEGERQRQQAVAALAGLLLVSALAALAYQGRRKEKASRLALAQKNEEIETRETRLSEAYRKLDELGRFKEAMASMIVHDLKNPLGLVIGLPDQGASARQLQAARLAGTQMLNLVTDILDVQRFEEARMRMELGDHPLRPTAAAALAQVAPFAADKGVALDDRVPDGLACRCDAEIVERVLVNLLTNAVKFTPGGGRVTVRAEAEGEAVRVAVSDTGAGIPADQIPLVFDKYHQVEARKAGSARSTGLGLAFCRLAVEALGGRIGVESRLGEGATFWFTLRGSAEPVAGEGGAVAAGPARAATLSDGERDALREALDRLRAVEIYEITAIRAALATVDPGSSPALAAWKEAVHRAAANGDQDAFDRLRDA